MHISPLDSGFVAMFMNGKTSSSFFICQINDQVAELPKSVN